MKLQERSNTGQVYCAVLVKVMERVVEVFVKLYELKGMEWGERESVNAMGEASF